MVAVFIYMINFIVSDFPNTAVNVSRVLEDITNAHNGQSLSFTLQQTTNGNGNVFFSPTRFPFVHSLSTLPLTYWFH